MYKNYEEYAFDLHENVEVLELVLHIYDDVRIWLGLGVLFLVTFMI